MKYFGIHSAFHDGAIAVIGEDGKLEHFAQAERFGERKRHYRDIKHISNLLPVPKKDDVVASSSLGLCNKKIKGVDPRIAMKWKDYPWVKYYKHKPQISVDHHLCHALSSWAFRENDDERLFLAYDGAGYSPHSTAAKCCLGGRLSKNKVEIIDIDPIPSSCYLNAILGPSSAGKAMGLAGYLTDLKMDVTQNDLLILAESVANENTNYAPGYPWIWPPYTQDKLELAAKLYRLWVQKVWSPIESNIKKHSNGQGMVIGGGSCLALEINTRIHGMVKDLVFGPAIDDSGLALGAAMYAYFSHKKEWPKPIKTPSLNELEKPNEVIGPQSPRDVAKVVMDNKVVCLIRGKAEAGPRALGFRSILARADKYSNLKRVSEDIKSREYYRPLAPIVTEEQFDKYFVGPKGKYMQYRVECTEECRRDLPAIVHKDNSSRPQVVCKANDPWLHELLVEFGKLSGQEVMINTSLNGKRMPICNSLDDVRNDMKNKDVQIVSVGPQIRMI